MTSRYRQAFTPYLGTRARGGLCLVLALSLAAPASAAAWACEPADIATPESSSALTDSETGALTGESVSTGDIETALAAPSPDGEADVSFEEVSESTEDSLLVPDTFSESSQGASEVSETALSNAPVRNLSTGESYGTLTEALAAAASEDTLQLASDLELAAALTLTKPLTLDLAGHRLVIDVTGSGAGGNAGAAAAFTLHCEGTVTLTDSTGRGTLDLRVGSRWESAAVASRGYRGIAVNAGALTLKAAAVNVVYAGGGTTAASDVTFAGASVGAMGSFALESGAELSVCGASDAAAPGATFTTGVRLEDGAPTVSIARDASLRVSNDGAAFERGSILLGEGDFRSRAFSVTPVALNEDSERYEALTDLFRQKAKLDLETDPDGAVFGAGLYHAAPLEVEGAPVIWAFSDIVPTEALGTAEALRPRLVFAQTLYDVPGTTCGIASASAESTVNASVRIDGALSVSSATGDATALGEGATAQWRVGAQAHVQVNAGSQPYRDGSEPFDLRPFLTNASPSLPALIYPSHYTGQIVQAKAPVARKEAATGAVWEAGASVVLSGCPEETAGVTPFAFPQEALVRVVTATPESNAAPELQAPWGATFAEAGLALPVPSDYADNQGVTQRFIGWSLNSATSSTIYSHDALMNETALNEDVVDIYNGTLTLYARYAPVSPGEELVRFEVDRYVFARAYAYGTTPAFTDVCPSTPNGQPAKLDADSGLTYAFAGWTGTDGTALGNTLPAVSADAAYRATFDATPARYRVGFKTWKQTEGKWANVTTFLNAPAGADAAELSRRVARIGEQVLVDGTVYELTGWAPRATDKFALYTDELPAVSGAVTYYGVYASAEQRLNVRFMVNGEPWAEALDAAGISLVDAVFRSTGAEAPQAPEGQRFRGWSATENGEPVRGTLVTIGSLAGLEPELTLYAVFGPVGGSESGSSGSGSDTNTKPSTGTGSGTATVKPSLPGTSGSGGALTGVSGGSGSNVSGGSGSGTAGTGSSSGNAATGTLAGASQSGAIAGSGPSTGSLAGANAATKPVSGTLAAASGAVTREKSDADNTRAGAVKRESKEKTSEAASASPSQTFEETDAETPLSDAGETGGIEAVAYQAEPLLEMGAADGLESAWGTQAAAQPASTGAWTLLGAVVAAFGALAAWGTLTVRSRRLDEQNDDLYDTDDLPAVERLRF